MSVVREDLFGDDQGVLHEVVMEVVEVAIAYYFVDHSAVLEVLAVDEDRVALFGEFLANLVDYFDFGFLLIRALQLLDELLEVVERELNNIFISYLYMVQKGLRDF